MSALGFEIDLTANKWQLVSFPVLPEDSSVESVFSLSDDPSLSVQVWGFNNESHSWKSWVPNGAFTPVEPLSELKVGEGYWVKTNQNISLNVESETRQSGSTVLHTGWNLIGYTAEQKISYEQALEGINFNQLWRYDSATGTFQVVEKSQGSQIVVRSEFTYLEPGQGYWINVSGQETLSPKLKTLLPPDIDIAPLVKLTEYGKPVVWTEMTTGDVNWGAVNGGEDVVFDFPNTQTHLGFGDFLNRQSISIENSGNGLLSWTIKIPDGLSWLYIETQDELGETVLVKELNGSTVNIPSQVIFRVDRTGIAADTTVTGQIQILGNGEIENKGIASEADSNLGIINVSMSVPDIIGDYEITVELETIDNKAADLHQPKYFLSLARDGALKGYLDPERSLLVPELTYLSGHFIKDPQGHFQVTGSVILPNKSDTDKDNEMNPFSRDIKREFSFVGQRSDGYDGLSPLDLKGDFSENIYGIKGDVIQVAGTFIAKRISPTPKEFDSVHQIYLTDESYIEGGETVVFEMDIAENISITDLKVLLSIEHPVPQEMNVQITSPSGISAILYQGAFSNGNLLDKEYDSIDNAIDSLDLYNGELSRGIWQLTVENTSSSNAELKQWELKFSGPEVYTLTGTLPGDVAGGVTVRISGCGISQTVITDANGNFQFDNLIPCDYQITISELGYQSKSETFQLSKSQCSDYVCVVTNDVLVALTPELIVSNETLLVTPTVASLPASITAMDIEDYGAESESDVQRTFKLYKKAANWWTIKEVNGERRLSQETTSSNQLPPGGNYIAYSETPVQWTGHPNVTLTTDADLDPKGGNEAVLATVANTGEATIFSSQTMGEGSVFVNESDKVTLSLFVKPGSTNEIQLSLQSDKGMVERAVFDVSTGEAVIEGIPTVEGEPAIATAHTASLANNWYRVSLTVEMAEYHSALYFSVAVVKAGLTSNIAGETLSVFGPQAEIHQQPNWLVEESVAATSIYSPLYETGYIDTQENHKTKLGEFDQEVLVETIGPVSDRKVAFAELGIDSQTGLVSKADAGLYVVKLETSLPEVGSNLINLYYPERGKPYLAAMAFNSGTGSTLSGASLYIMDSATHDIDRVPFSDAQQAGLEDSNYFNNQINMATGTNQLCHPGGPQETEPKGTPCMDSTLDESVGDQQHFRMFMSFGQPMTSGSIYGELPKDESDPLSVRKAIRMDVGIQSQTNLEEFE